jgi:imidazolonepropionase-like amidohydrolase
MGQRSKTSLSVSVVAASALIAGAAVPVPAGFGAATTRYAIRDARIVTMAGAPIDKGTIVFQGGVIEDVGPSIAVPDDAVVIDGARLTVYPGFIDLASTAAVDLPATTVIEPARGGGPQAPLTPAAAFEEQERARRAAMIRADVDAARYVRYDGPIMRRLASAGITTVLAVPPAGLLRGQSALINVLAPPDDPQISGLADNRRAQVVVKSPVALHIAFAGGGGRGVFPASLLGTIAFIRQALHDAKWQRDARAFAEKHPERPRPAVDPALDALAPVIDGRLPAAFEADSAVEIARALSIAREFSLDPIIVGGREAADVVADLKAASARVIYSLNYPAPPETGRGGRGRGALTPPEPDESIRAMRLRQNAPKAPRALQEAGVPFAFTTDGMEDLSEFMSNAARTVKDGGLSPDALMAALTINAARLVGADNRLGTLQRGRIANLVVTEGTWPDEGTRIRHVFIDGVPVEIDPPPATPARGRRGGGP